MTNEEAGSRSRYDDEISLVDLAATFLRRRRVFYVVFLVTVLAGLGYAMLTPAKYEYVSLVKLAEKGEQEYLEQPLAVIAELDNHWKPKLQATFRAENERKLPFDVTFSNPKDTGLVRIVSEAPAAQSELVEQVHGGLVSQLEKGQAQAVSSLRKKLEKRIDSLDATVEMLRGAQDAGPSMASAIEQLASLENELASIEPLESLVVSRQSADPKGPAKSLIVVLAGLLGLMAGVFLAFFAEFVGLVRDQLAEA